MMYARCNIFFLKVTALVMGLSVEILAKTFDNETLRACHVYPLSPDRSLYITPFYEVASPSLHVSVLTSLSDRQMNKIDLNIMITLRSTRLVEIYLKENVVTIRLDDRATSGNVHLSRSRRSPFYSVVPRWFGINSSSEPVDSISRKLDGNGTNKSSPPEEHQLKTMHLLRWWSISIYFTERFIFARLDGTTATVVASSSPDVYRSFPASARVASSHRTAVMFDCVHGCPVFTSTLDNMFFPLTHTSPVTVIFLCAENRPKHREPNTSYHLTPQISKCSERSALHTHAADEGHFRFSLSAFTQNDDQCVTVTLSSSTDGASVPGHAPEDDQHDTSSPVCQQLVVQRTATPHGRSGQKQFKPNVTGFELRSGPAQAPIVRLSVNTLTRAGNPSLTVADATEAVNTVEPAVFLHPLDYSGLTASFDCPSKQFLESLESPLEKNESSSEPQEPKKGRTKTGTLWSVLALITLVAIVLLVLFFIYIRPRNPWEDSATEMDSLSIPETVSVISRRTCQQYSDPPPFLYHASLASNDLIALHDDGMVKPSHAKNLRHQREAEEVSEPGSPPPCRGGARAALDLEELCVSSLPLLDVRSLDLGPNFEDECRVFGA